MRLCLALCLGAIVCTQGDRLESRGRSGTAMPGRLAIQSTPTAAEIMELALARAQKQDAAGAELGYESVIATAVHRVNGDGEITQTETTLHRRYPVEGELFEEMIQRNGEPLSPDEVQDQQEARERFAREVRERAERGEQIETNDERQIRFDRDLSDRFRASVEGETEIRGELCWVLAFEPRPGDLPERTRLDKVLNRSSGRLLISQQDFGPVQIEFEMREPVRYLWGLIATLRSAEGQLQFERVGDDFWFPQRYDIEIDLRVLFRSRRERIIREWIERQPRDPEVG